MASSTDLVILDDAAVAKVLMGEEVAFISEVDDPTAVQRQIVARILAAENPEAVLAQSETTAADEVVGVPLQVQGVRWVESRIKDAALPVFALIDAVRGDDGERILVTCGALQVMAGMLRLAQLGAFPIDVVIERKAEPTAAGYYPLWLAPVKVAATT